MRQLVECIEMRTLGFAGLVLSLAGALGCGSTRDEGQTSAFTGVGTATATSGTDDTDDSDDSDPGPRLDLGGEDTTGSMDTSDECFGVSATADVQLSPADIIIVVDNSGSMDFEANAVQSNLNNFSMQLAAENVDARVVLLSSYPDNGNGICISPPLGGGGCPTDDNNPPDYVHVDQRISSGDALAQIVGRWEDYADVMRPEAVKHVLIVSDDNSEVPAADFTAQFLGLDDAHAGFRLHAIVADADPVTSCLNGNPCCAISAAAGTVYLNLVNQTGGLFGNLCLQQFQPIFDELATEVVDGAYLACEYEIPPPPEGETFDPDQVNVEFDDGAGGTLNIGRVDSAADCAGVTDGWYYDDPQNPTMIHVCEQTCDRLQGFVMATISIIFGCATIPAG
jgi:hypothetical protein